MGFAGLFLLGLLTESDSSRVIRGPAGQQASPPFTDRLLALGSKTGRQAAPPREKTLLFVGDVMLARGVGQKIRSEGNCHFPFLQIASTLRAADLTYGNLECPISNQGRDLHHRYSFRADPATLEGLQFSGLRVVSLANNHAYDWGPRALLDTLRRLRERGVKPVGAGCNDLEAHYPVLVNLDGVKLGFLAYVNVEPQEATAGINRAGVAWLEPKCVLADIRFARRLVDVLIVCPHWGMEYAREPSSDQAELARQMIDAGADLIVGSHPHVVQPVETYHMRWIAYSLGNFIFDQKDAASRRGLMLKATLRGKCISRVEPIPICIQPNYQAAIDAPHPARNSRFAANRMTVNQVVESSH